MSVLSMKPYWLQYSVVQPEYRDESGDWHSGEVEWIDSLVRCDIVKNDTTALIREYEQGDEVKHSYTVYLDKVAPTLSVGTKVRILDKDGNELLVADVKGFTRYQLQCKMWL